MSLFSRIANVLRGDRVSGEIDEELESHLEEAMRQGRDPEEARQAFGSALRQREQSRDVRLAVWLDSLRADAVFGWRQLKKNHVTSAAAILSLGLAIGACTAAFRLIDALLLRPLPIAEPERLYSMVRHGVGPEGRPQSFDGCEYPLFQRMRSLVKDQAELIAISYGERVDLTYATDQEMEKAHLQYVSGWMFQAFGLQPAAGRLLTEQDDLHPGAHPYAVLSYDYWTRRFARDPKAVGHTFRFGDDLYQIAGVVQGPFSGTEPGTATDIFIPTMMNLYVSRSDATWFRPLALVRPGVPLAPLREKLHGTMRAFLEDRAKGFTGMPKQRIAGFVNQTLVLEPAPTGVSDLQNEYRRSLAALAVLVALVLLIACANVANLMLAQAAARAREMALRVSIGAGQRRLVQLVLVESVMLAFLAAALGGLFAWWSAPFVVSRINPPDNPARLFLPADWRVLAFGLALTLAVTFLFGLVPALRASAVKPAGALKGGEDPHSRRRLMHGLIAVQVAFCFLVLFVAGLFVATFDRLTHLSTGSSAERLLVLDTTAQKAELPVFWEQVAARLRAMPGVETVALSDWALMNGNSRNNFISINGAPPTPILTYFRYVGPGWMDAMRIPILAGRDFRPSDTSPGAAIVNTTFAKQYFNGENPVGRYFDRGMPGRSLRYQIVGLTRDAIYRNMREPMLAVAFVPLQATGPDGAGQAIREATFLVRTSGANPLALAPALRLEVTRARADFRVRNVHTQVELNQAQTVRERLLAMLALFFAVVALLLAAVGLYGVLDYSVLQRRREIGIRMALGAEAFDIARRVTTEASVMVLTGALAGVTVGLVSVRWIEALFYQVKPTDLPMLAVPALTIVVAASVAALPAVVRAVRIDPAVTLRRE